MKRLFIFIFLIFMSSISAYAKDIKVSAMSDFSTANPPEIWKVKVVQGVTTKSGFEVCVDSIIEGKIDQVVAPKRLKQNAKFVFIPIKYYDSLDGKVYEIEQNIKGKYSTKTDTTFQSVARKGIEKVGNHFADGLFGPGLALVEGAIKNEEGNRAKSMAKSVYKKLPISYIDKGNEIVINEGQIFIMSFSTVNAEVDSNEDVVEELEESID